MEKIADIFFILSLITMLFCGALCFINLELAHRVIPVLIIFAVVAIGFYAVALVK